MSLPKNTNAVFEAIAQHAAAYAAFAAISDCTDEVLAKQRGRVVTKEDHAIWEKLDAAENAARQAVCRAPIGGSGELRAKAAYLLAINCAQVELQLEDYHALLESIAGLSKAHAV